MSNTSDNKRIAKNTIFLYIRMLLVMFITLFTSRVVLHTLGESDYGIYNVVGGVVTSLTFISLAMANSTSRFLTFALGKKDETYLKLVFSTALWIHIIVALIIFLIAETIGLWFLNNKMYIPESRLFAANIVYQFSIVTTVCSIIGSPFNSAIIAHERMHIFAYISIFDVVGKLIIAYLLYISSYDRLILYASLLMSIQIIDIILYVRYCKKNFPEVGIKKIKNYDLVKNIGSFAGWSLIGNLSFMGYTQGVNIILNLFFGPVINAARAIAVQVQTALMSFIQNFQTAVSPQITKSYASNDINRVQTLLYNSSRFSFFILYCMLLPICLEVNTILSIWLGKVPDHTGSFLRIILLISMLDCLTRPVTIAMNATGNIKKYQLVSCGILLLIVPLSFFFLKLGLPAEIAFFVHLIVALIALATELKIYSNYVGVQISEYLKKVILPIIKVVIVSSIIPILFHNYYDDHTLSHCILCMIISTSSVVIAIYSVGLTPLERLMIKTKLNSLNNNVIISLKKILPK